MPAPTACSTSADESSDSGVQYEYAAASQHGKAESERR